MEVGFGTSGLRGTSEALLGGAAAAHAGAFCRHLVESGLLEPGASVFIGADRRPSSPALIDACVDAVTQAGLRPMACGEVPTPALAHYAMARKAAAIMVTGSHIPADRNGLKFYLPGGEITKQDERAIAARASGGAPTAAGGNVQADRRHAACHEEVVADWLARYRGVLPADVLSGLRLGIDEHSSVGTGLLGEILAGFGARIVRFGQTERFMPLDTEAVAAERLDLYAGRLAAGSLFAVATTDPDGDRPLLVDETGKPLRGDLLGWITAQWLGADAVAVPVNGNSRIASRDGLRVTRTRIGSPYVLEAIGEATASGARCSVGFEPNGGFMLGSATAPGTGTLEALPTRDAVLPVLGTLQHAVRHGLPLSALAREHGFRPAASDRIADFPVERSRALMARLADDPGRVAAFVEPVGPVRHVDWTDGARITLADGDVVHLRPSGNAPEMRCYVEAADEAAARRLLEWGLARAREMCR